MKKELVHIFLSLKFNLKKRQQNIENIFMIAMKHLKMN